MIYGVFVIAGALYFVSRAWHWIGSQFKKFSTKD